MWVSEEGSAILLLLTERDMLLLGSLDKNVTNSRKSQIVTGLDLGVLDSRINTVTDFKNLKFRGTKRDIEISYRAKYIFLSIKTNPYFKEVYISFRVWAWLKFPS